jgi:hypothetical protein
MAASFDRFDDQQLQIIVVVVAEQLVPATEDSRNGLQFAEHEKILY